MLSQLKAEALMTMKKELAGCTQIDFPGPWTIKQLDATSEDGQEAFVFDVNRKLGKKYKLTKCTYQERYATIEILLRLDIEGPPHDNPDGTTVPCPHLHVYRE